MKTYENAHNFIEAFQEALKDKAFSETEKDSMKQIIKNDQIGQELGSGRLFSTKNHAFVVHEATIGYNLGIVE